MSEESAGLTYFRGEFIIDSKPERLVIVIDSAQRKIVFADYEENAVDLARQMEESGFDKGIARNEEFLRRIFGGAESLLCFDTYQFGDYSKIDQDRFDEKKKAASRKEHFPDDCRRAFEMGVRLTNEAAAPLTPWTADGDSK